MSGHKAVVFVDPQRARDLVRGEPVIFAEIVGAGGDDRTLEVRVMRRDGDRIYEVERDHMGPIAWGTVNALVEQIAAAHHCRYATIYPAGDR